jgi:hypothetical protein
LDEHFGEGYSEKKLGKNEFQTENAEPWDLSSLR